MDTEHKTAEAHGNRGRTIIALATVYLAWSSTYLAIRFSLEAYPPYFTAGFRYMLVGLGMALYLRARGTPLPSMLEWRNSAITGAFLIFGGTGGSVYAMQKIGSGTAAIVLATTPLWTVLFGGIWRQWPARNEWIGLLLGFAGIVILNAQGDLQLYPASALILLIAALSWSFGSVLSMHLAVPRGMMAGAAQMFTGGVLVLAVSWITGEQMPLNPSIRSTAAMIYLGVVGSLLGFTAFAYLLKNVRPALAMSYSYVNPVLAVLLGAMFADERISPLIIAAMATILSGVVLVAWRQRKG